MGARRRDLYFGAHLVTAMLFCAPAHAAGSASKPAPLSVAASGELPFSAAELEQMLAIRLSGEKQPLPHIEVHASGADAVEIAVADKRRVVSLLGQRGTAAARRVALAIVDLVREDLSVPLSELAPIDTASVAATASTTVSVLARRVPLLPGPEAAPGPQPELYSFGARLILGVPSTAGAGIEGWLHLDEQLRLVMSADFMLRPEASAPGAIVDTNLSIPIHAGVGWRFTEAPIAVRASAVFTLLWLQGTRGIDHLDQVVGAGASATYFVPFSPAAQVTFSAGADFYITRIRFRAYDRRLYLTDRFAAHLAVGINFGGAP